MALLMATRPPKTDSESSVTDIPKVVSEVTTTVPETTTAVHALVDEYLTLYKALLAIEGKQKATRMDAIRKELVAYGNQHFTDGVPVKFETTAGTIFFSERSQEMVIGDVFALIKLIMEKFPEQGVVLINTIFKTGLGELKKVLSEQELLALDYVKKEPGTRTLKAVELARP